MWVVSDKTDGCSNTIPGWKNVELGYLPNGSQADVVFSNKLLERFTVLREHIFLTKANSGRFLFKKKVDSETLKKERTISRNRLHFLDLIILLLLEKDSVFHISCTQSSIF